MTLDKLIERLQEAKEHYVPSKSKVKIDVNLTINGEDISLTKKSEIIEVWYDDKNVTIQIAEDYD